MAKHTNLTLTLKAGESVVVRNPDGSETFVHNSGEHRAKLTFRALPTVEVWCSDIDPKRNGNASERPPAGLWRCCNCGEGASPDTIDPSWRWAGDRMQHRCSGPQAGHFDCRWFGNGNGFPPTSDTQRVAVQDLVRYLPVGESDDAA
jgi:hypothetical protein